MTFLNIETIIIQELVTKAKLEAEYWHRIQKYGDLPYVSHLQDVVNLVAPFGNVPVILAWLHDIGEDTSCPSSRLATLFGDYLTDCVWLLTDESGVNRKERKARTLEKLKAADVRFKVVYLVKVADRLANVRNCVNSNNLGLLQMYKKE